MKQKKITCIVCPLGCEVTVSMDGDKITDISGHSCKRGAQYAETELTDPRRTLTTTIRVQGGTCPLVSVKSAQPIKKDMLFECMKQINDTTVKAPVQIGDVLISNICGLDANIVATADVACYNGCNERSHKGDGVQECAAPSQQQMAAV